MSQPIRNARARLLSAVAAASAVLAIAAAPAHADPAPMPTTRSEAQTQAEQAQAAVDQLVAEVSEQQAKLDALNAQVESAGQTYADEQQKLARAQADEAAALAAQQQAQAAYDTQHDRLVDVLRQQYMLGRPSSVAAIMTATSETGMLAQLQTTTLIADHQKGVVVDFNTALLEKTTAEAVSNDALHRQDAATSAANEALIAAANAREQAAAVQADLDAKLETAKLDQRTAQTALNLLSGRTGSVSSAQQAALNSKYRDMLASWDGSTDDPGMTAVYRALQWIGTPYAWAGGGYSGPSRGTAVDEASANDGNVIGFDCSGLVMYAYAPYLSLPHLASQQYSVAGSVHPAIGELQPGDLVFWGTGGAGIHHVAIYIGDGNVIQAPYSGGTVEITPLDAVSSDFYGATRPLS